MTASDLPMTLEAHDVPSHAVTVTSTPASLTEAQQTGS
jgi:hypothetical protein